MEYLFSPVSTRMNSFSVENLNNESLLTQLILFESNIVRLHKQLRQQTINGSNFLQSDKLC